MCIFGQFGFTEANFPNSSMHHPGFINAIIDFPGLDLLNRLTHVESDSTDPRIRHQAAWTENFADPADRAHYIRSSDNAIEIQPILFLDFFDQLFAADEISPGFARLALLIAFGQYQNAKHFTGAMRQHHSTAHVLIRLTRINPKTHRQFDSLVKFRDFIIGHQLERFL